MDLDDNVRRTSRTRKLNPRFSDGNYGEYMKLVGRITGKSGKGSTEYLNDSHDSDSSSCDASRRGSESEKPKLRPVMSKNKSMSALNNKGGWVSGSATERGQSVIEDSGEDGSKKRKFSLDQSEQVKKLRPRRVSLERAENGNEVLQNDHEVQDNAPMTFLSIQQNTLLNSNNDVTENHVSEASKVVQPKLVICSNPNIQLTGKKIKILSLKPKIDPKTMPLSASVLIQTPVALKIIKKEQVPNHKPTEGKKRGRPKKVQQVSSDSEDELPLNMLFDNNKTPTDQNNKKKLQGSPVRKNRLRPRNGEASTSKSVQPAIKAKKARKDSLNKESIRDQIKALKKSMPIKFDQNLPKEEFTLKQKVKEVKEIKPGVDLTKLVLSVDESDTYTCVAVDNDKIQASPVKSSKKDVKISESGKTVYTLSNGLVTEESVKSRKVPIKVSPSKVAEESSSKISMPSETEYSDDDNMLSDSDYELLFVSGTSGNQSFEGFGGTPIKSNESEIPSDKNLEPEIPKNKSETVASSNFSSDSKIYTEVNSSEVKERLEVAEKVFSEDRIDKAVDDESKNNLNKTDIEASTLISNAGDNKIQVQTAENLIVSEIKKKVEILYEPQIERKGEILKEHQLFDGKDVVNGKLVEKKVEKLNQLKVVDKVEQLDQTQMKVEKPQVVVEKLNEPKVVEEVKQLDQLQVVDRKDEQLNKLQVVEKNVEILNEEVKQLDQLQVIDRKDEQSNKVQVVEKDVEVLNEPEAVEEKIEKLNEPKAVKRKFEKLNDLQEVARKAENLNEREAVKRKIEKLNEPEAVKRKFEKLNELQVVERKFESLNELQVVERKDEKLNECKVAKRKVEQLNEPQEVETETGKSSESQVVRQKLEKLFEPKVEKKVELNIAQTEKNAKERNNLKHKTEVKKEEIAKIVHDNEKTCDVEVKSESDKGKKEKHSERREKYSNSNDKSDRKSKYDDKNKDYKDRKSEKSSDRKLDKKEKSLKKEDIERKEKKYEVEKQDKKESDKTRDKKLYDSDIKEKDRKEEKEKNRKEEKVKKESEKLDKKDRKSDSYKIKSEKDLKSEHRHKEKSDKYSDKKSDNKSEKELSKKSDKNQSSETSSQIKGEKSEKTHRKETEISPKSVKSENLKSSIKLETAPTCASGKSSQVSIASPKTSVKRNFEEALETSTSSVIQKLKEKRKNSIDRKVFKDSKLDLQAILSDLSRLHGKKGGNGELNQKSEYLAKQQELKKNSHQKLEHSFKPPELKKDSVSKDVKFKSSSIIIDSQQVLSSSRENRLFKDEKAGEHKNKDFAEKNVNDKQKSSMFKDEKDKQTKIVAERHSSTEQGSPTLNDEKVKNRSKDNSYIEKISSAKQQSPKDLKTEQQSSKVSSGSEKRSSFKRGLNRDNKFLSIESSNSNKTSVNKVHDPKVKIDSQVSSNVKKEHSVKKELLEAAKKESSPKKSDEKSRNKESKTSYKKEVKEEVIIDEAYVVSKGLILSKVEESVDIGKFVGCYISNEKENDKKSAGYQEGKKENAVANEITVSKKSENHKVIRKSPIKLVKPYKTEPKLLEKDSEPNKKQNSTDCKLEAKKEQAVSPNIEKVANLETRFLGKAEIVRSLDLFSSINTLLTETSKQASSNTDTSELEKVVCDPENEKTAIQSSKNIDTPEAEKVACESKNEKFQNSTLVSEISKKSNHSSDSGLTENISKLTNISEIFENSKTSSNVLKDSLGTPNSKTFLEETKDKSENLVDFSVTCKETTTKAKIPIEAPKDIDNSIKKISEDLEKTKTETSFANDIEVSTNTEFFIDKVCFDSDSYIPGITQNLPSLSTSEGNSSSSTPTSEPDSYCGYVSIQNKEKQEKLADNKKFVENVKVSATTVADQGAFSDKINTSVSSAISAIKSVDSSAKGEEKISTVFDPNMRASEKVLTPKGKTSLPNRNTWFSPELQDSPMILPLAIGGVRKRLDQSLSARCGDELKAEGKTKKTTPEKVVEGLSQDRPSEVEKTDKVDTNENDKEKQVARNRTRSLNIKQDSALGSILSFLNMSKEKSPSKTQNTESPQNTNSSKNLSFEEKIRSPSDEDIKSPSENVYKSYVDDKENATPLSQIKKTSKKLSHEKKMEDLKNKKVVEERLKNFEHLDENLYLVERVKNKKSKEARRMVCDCNLSKEEILNGEKGCLEDCLNRLLMIECGSRCPLAELCSNKRFENKEYSNVEVFNAAEKGCGVRAVQDIKNGDFILEYIGEVFDTREFKRRIKEYAKESSAHFYFMALGQDRLIDSTRKGNISRFVNHSCMPNAETQKWTVNGEIRIGFFASRDISADEEINFDYRMERYGREPQKCYCGTPLCRGWLGEPPDEKTREEKEYGKRREKKKKVEDNELEEDIDKLCSRGLWGKQDILNLSRIMVRCEGLISRSRLLGLLKTGDNTMKRLFLDYHGLSILWSWMVDISSSFKCVPLKLEILEILESLPITNKTQVVESKVLHIVERWTNEQTHRKDIEKERLLEAEKSTKARDDGSDSDSENFDASQTSHDESSQDSAQKTKETTEKSTENKENERCKVKNSAEIFKENVEKITDVVALASKLVSTWVELKEAFKIPRKQRIKMMKEHERELDKQYDRYLKTRGLVDVRSSNTPSYDSLRNEKFAREYRRRMNSVNSMNTSTVKRRKEIEFDPSLSKEERREKFAQLMAKEEEDRQKRHQEELWNLHLERCNLLSQDPYYTPIFDPSGNFFWDPDLKIWIQYTGQHTSYPLPADYVKDVVTPESPQNKISPAESISPKEQKNSCKDSKKSPKDVEKLKDRENSHKKSEKPHKDKDLEKFHKDKSHTESEKSNKHSEKIQKEVEKSHKESKKSHRILEKSNRDSKKSKKSKENSSVDGSPENVNILCIPLPCDLDIPLPGEAKNIPQPPLPDDNMEIDTDISEYVIDLPQKLSQIISKLPIHLPPASNNVNVIHQSPGIHPNFHSPITNLSPGMSPHMGVNLTSPFGPNQSPLTNMSHQMFPPFAPTQTPPFTQFPLYPAQLTPLYQTPVNYTPDYNYTPEMSDFPPEPVIKTVKLPPNWKMARNDSGCLYFYHVQTRTTQWEIPPVDLHKKLMTQYGLDCDSDSDSDYFDSDSDDSSSSTDEEAASLSSKTSPIKVMKGGREKVAENLNEKMLCHKTKKSRSSALVQERIISPVEEFIDKEELRRERRAAKEKARIENRYERVEMRAKKSKITAKNALKALKANMAIGISSKSKKLKKKKGQSKNKMKERVWNAMADTSEDAKQAKELFMGKMATYIVAVLNTYRKPECTEGRIENHEDFKYLARKLTHFVMLKELKQVPTISDLDCSDSVKHKTREFVRKYMAKYGTVFVRDPNDKDY